MKNYRLLDRFSSVQNDQRNFVLRWIAAGRRLVPRLQIGLLLMLWSGCAVITGAAGDTNSARALADLSLEQLMNETVTSVSKKEQKLGNAAAAISVLSNDDLRRSGATSIPEALRSVPGLNVSAFNSSQWAISSRGFNGIYANKLLVLVDGRAVYTPVFAGVYWDLQQSMLADLDRIEVIRGPGAAVWGANAVNGVINVVSRSARETLGGYTYAGGGDFHQVMAGARYGFQTSSNTFLRLFGSYQLNDDYPLATGQSADDGWFGEQVGFRLDHYPDENTQATWQGDYTGSNLQDESANGYNLNTLGRWKHSFSDRSGYEAQAYYDRTDRSDALRAHIIVDTIDLSAQHTFSLGDNHDIIWGAGYRFINNYITPTTPVVAVYDRSSFQNVVSAFLQDEWKIVPDRFIGTLGTKLEHNDLTGWEWQPTLRAVFKPTEHQTLWGAISRAVRTPSEVEGMALGAIQYGTPFIGPGGLPYQPLIVGNPNVEAETLWAYELGYRVQVTPRISADLSLFYNDYDQLIVVGPITQFVPGTPGEAQIPFGNYEHGHTYGGELSVTFAATDSWRLTASYAAWAAQIHSITPFSSPESTEDGAPRNQIMLRSAYDFSKQLSLDVQVRYVDTMQAVPSYVAADVQLTYRPTPQFEFSLVGQNLGDRQHPEYRSEALTRLTEVPRGFYGKVSWRF
ncbi:MAG: TonB-dependent receptor [Verrucomicrobiota bacterium]